MSQATNYREERRLEQRLVRAAAAAGGVALKFSSPARRGVPDRLVLLPGGRVGFVEVKRPGAQPSPQQAHVLAFLRQLGVVAEVVDSEEDLGKCLARIANRGREGSNEDC